MDDVLSGAEHGAQRGAGGRWLGGHCPNPSGRPRKTDAEREAEAIAKKNAAAVMRRLVATALDPKAHPSDYLRAAEQVLDRALGKPAVRDASADLAGVRFVVQQFAVTVAPVPGVTNSPIAGHISARRLAASSGEVIEAS